jgi:hypothetical protein
MHAFSVLTYATHSQGSFEELVRSLPGIRVGGWGEKWSGFTQKFQFVLAYAEACDDRHIIIFVDGFDTELRRPPEEAVRRFLRMGAQFLVSSLGVEMQLPALVSRSIFKCTDADCANTGLYMGFAAAVRQVLAAALLEERALLDDQRALELARARLPRGLVRVDSDCDVFHNLNLRERRRGGEVKAVFVGKNGTSTFASWRAGRGRVLHFSRVLAHELLLVVLVATLAVAWKRFSLPSLCCGDLVFPACILVAVLFVPAPSLTFSSGVFLLALFSLVFASVPHPRPARGGAA